MRLNGWYGTNTSHRLFGNSDSFLRRGVVEVFGKQEELTAAINEPSTNLIGVKTDGSGIKTAIAGDELEIFQQTAGILPVLYEGRDTEAEVLTLEQADIMESYQDMFISAVLIVAMFMGCTFNAMNIISEKEDGVAFVNEVLPMTPSQYIIQKVMVGFLCGGLSSVITACTSWPTPSTRKPQVRCAIRWTSS